MLAEMKNFAANGIQFSDQTVTKGMPAFGMVGGMRLTEIIDNHTSLVASPKARARLIKKIQEGIAGRSNHTYEQQLIKNIRVGNPAVPYGQRPSLYAAGHLQAQSKWLKGWNYGNEQQHLMFIEDPNSPYLDYEENGVLQPGVGRLMPTDPRYPAAIQRLPNYLEQNNVPGAEKVLNDIIKQRGELIKTIEPPKVGATEVKSAEFGAMPAENFAPDKIADRLQEARHFAQQNANDPTKQQELFDKQEAVINRRAQEYLNITNNVTPAVEASLSVFYDDEAVKAILKPSGVSGGSKSWRNWARNYQQALTEFSAKTNVRRMVLQVNNDMRQAARSAILKAGPGDDLQSKGAGRDS